MGKPIKIKASGQLWAYLLAGLILLNPSMLRADQFPIFDGHVYNGKYYPRVDIIEWSDTPGDPTYMDFHVYSKKDPLDLTFRLDSSTGKQVMLVNYFFPTRPEHQCRRVLAPQHFGGPFFVYKDASDPDYNSIILTTYKLPAKSGRSLVSNPPQYATCTDDNPERVPASNNAPTNQPAPPAGAPNDQVRTKSDPGALKSKGQAVPFGDW